MPTPTSNPNPASGAATLAGIRRAAEETLAAWPEARAAVLFGSRARGDHGPSSDWDVAFITRGGDRVTAIPAGLPIEALPFDVQALALPEGVAWRKALAIGHVGRGVARDGQLLAGRWSRPRTVGEPEMEPDSYWRFIQNVAGYIEVAALRVADVGEDDGSYGSYVAASGFIAQTADAAEHLAKAMLGRHGVDPHLSHSVAELADQAARTGHPDLAKDVREMDGFTRKDHVAGYGPPPTERLAHAVRRLPVVLRQLGRELASASGDPKYAALFPDLARFVARKATAAEDTVRLAKRPGGAESAPHPTPEELKPLVEALDTFAVELLLLRHEIRPLGRTAGLDRGIGRSPFD